MRQVVGVHFESVERPDFRLCTRCYHHEINTEQLSHGAHPMQRITKDAHTQVRRAQGVAAIGFRRAGPRRTDARTCSPGTSGLGVQGFTGS